MGSAVWIGRNAQRQAKVEAYGNGTVSLLVKEKTSVSGLSHLVEAALDAAPAILLYELESLADLQGRVRLQT